MDCREHITVIPAVLHGKACIRGTRIPDAVVLANLADGLSAEEIVKSYPSLTVTGIRRAGVLLRGRTDCLLVVIVESIPPPVVATGPCENALHVEQ